MGQRGGLVLSFLNSSGLSLLLLKQYIMPHDITERYLAMLGGCCRVAIALCNPKTSIPFQKRHP